MNRAAVTAINTATNQVVGSPIQVGVRPGGIAITPDQAPLASFAPAFTRPGVPLTLNGSASRDPDGTIASFAWGFGDGSAGLNTGTTPTATHTYAAPGTYAATLAVTDNEGCSSALIFTGQTAYCNGLASASQTQPVTVAYPGVSVRCPKSAKPKGCRISLAVVAKKPTKKKPKPKLESATTKLKLAAGKSAIASLKPKPPYSAALATATKVLVKESVKVAGSQRTSYKKLQIVQ